MLTAQASAIGVKPNKPDTYAGGLDPAVVEQWSHQIKQYILLQGVAPQFQVALAATFLKGPALTWWVDRNSRVAQGTVAPCTTMDEFVLAVRTHFVLMEGKLVARDKLAKLTQKTFVAAYSEEFIKLVLSIPGMTEDEKIDSFTRGLKPGTRKEVMLRQCASIQECMANANRVDSILWSTHSFGSISNHQSSVGDTATPMELGVAQREFSGDCFTCGEWEHRASECPKQTYTARGRGRGAQDEDEEQVLQRDKQIMWR